MAFQKRIDYGFNGYQVPRGCRSARGRSSLKRKVEDTQMGAFELLATVAGKLLQEREASPASGGSGTILQATIGKDNVKQEQRDEEKSPKVESCDQGSSQETSLVSKPNHNKSSEQFTHVVSDHASLVVNCDKSEKAEGTVIGNSQNQMVPDTCNLDDMLDSDTKPPALVSSESSIEQHPTSGPFPGCQGNVQFVSRDDTDNSSGCAQPSTTHLKASRPPPRLEDRKIKKFMESKYWDVAPKLEGELSNTDGDITPISRNKNVFYTGQRSLRNTFKRTKFEKRAASTSHGGVSSEVISNSPKNGKNGNTNSLVSTTHGGSGISSSSAAGHESSSQSKVAHVKLSIKSFRVPELFIEISETATVGSLKRSVMEAVAAIIGEGLHVGVLYQGKKIRDDSKTLLQTGICDDDNLDGLGFALEPSPTIGPDFCPIDLPYLVQSGVPQLLTRCTPSLAIDTGRSEASQYTPLTNLTNSVESDHDSVLSPTDMSIDKTMTDSSAPVPHPAMSVDGLAVVPLHRKSRRSDLVQRRIRRPFSVHEVEALVHAVEKLGTGRWRDVKLRAFDKAKHRTYVDLKDKWKTLVHTARISPQQRRGEPVPQELLDRVLAAHAYWSQRQAKHQVRQLT